MHIGVVADDLTGANDIAGFLADSGLEVMQFMGVPDRECQAGAAVVSLKTRSLPADQAVSESLAALEWLEANHCRQFYFKYCSTFDSTAQGNIGPVADAFLDRLGLDFTVVCPTLPANGRVVENGILLVNGAPLAETGMRNHPINPMTDSDVVRLMARQSRGRPMLLSMAVVRQGAAAALEGLDRLRREGCRYAVLDSATDADLDVLAEATADLTLLTGGSGLGAARARLVAAGLGLSPDKIRPSWRPPRGKAAALSGSCSEMTNRQVETYGREAPSAKVEVSRCFEGGASYAAELAAWADRHSGRGPAPLIFATVGKDELARNQAEWGAAAAAGAVERLFSNLALELDRRGFDAFIVAGGETSGSVNASLGARAFHIGPEIAPGVSWLRGADRPLSLALKSGNFGDSRFFFRAQELMG